MTQLAEQSDDKYTVVQTANVENSDTSIGAVFGVKMAVEARRCYGLI